MIEFGRMMMMQQILTNASREGARRAIVETTTNGEVVSVVNDYLASTGIAGATVTVSPTDLSAIALGDPVTVRVTTPYSANSWLPSPWFLGGTSVQAESVMRAERLQ
jgi:Flp pilus assembly protein TadG